jgi:hypothetical protein
MENDFARAQETQRRQRVNQVRAAAIPLTTSTSQSAQPLTSDYSIPSHSSAFVAASPRQIKQQDHFNITLPSSVQPHYYMVSTPASIHTSSLPEQQVFTTFNPIHPFPSYPLYVQQPVNSADIQ